MLVRYYRRPALSRFELERLGGEVCRELGVAIEEIETEYCYNVELDTALTPDEEEILHWLLAETFDPVGFSTQSFVEGRPTVLEVGPRLNFQTAWSSTAVAICHDCGLGQVTRLERSTRFGLPVDLKNGTREQFLAPFHDRMTEEPYEEPPESFETGLTPEPVRIIQLREQGIAALEQVNRELGLGMDEQDLEWCYNLFTIVLGRNPTDVELFQLGQVISEHCRHGFFKGILVIDGVVIGESLLELIMAPWRANPGNSVIGFHDNASAIRGLAPVTTLVPLTPGQPCRMITAKALFHWALTAETHNFPTGICPFPGATTGTGGRIRDNLGVGRGGLMEAGSAAYCVGNLRIPGYKQSWEINGWTHPPTLASPLEILIQASNGASSYGNCIGEPVIYGFARSFGLELPDGFWSWFKPIMYTSGLSLVDDRHTEKHPPQRGMLVIQIGGPAYRIGLGGGSASSQLQGAQSAELDFDAVQRGAAEMEQRVWRVIRALIELGDDNAIEIIHDLGAGGDCNAVTEIISPAGARIELRKIPVGDKTLSTLVIWGNESQERMVFLIYPEHLPLVTSVCEREQAPLAVLGEITGDGQLVLHDEQDDTTPVNLPLDKILEDLPRKRWQLERLEAALVQLNLPEQLTVFQALNLVLRDLSVASKRFLVSKVDRSVGGKVTQQQCVGPYHLPLSDYASIAQSHFSNLGCALSLGERPLMGFISPAAMARLAVAEALLNMAGAKITWLADIKCSANWMWAAKLPGEGARLYDAACALRDILIALGLAIDGGKDSLTMATRVTGPDGKEYIVKSPGQLVIANYATMEDVERAVGPVMPPSTTLYYLTCSPDQHRLGGSALAHVFQQVGDECPDVEDIDLLKRTFEAVQELVEKGLVSAVHDVSDGGVITTLLEMAFAGGVGFTASFWAEVEPGSTPWTLGRKALRVLFSEEPGLVFCVSTEHTLMAEQVLSAHGVSARKLGHSRTSANTTVRVSLNNHVVLDEDMLELRAIWEATSTAIDELQANPECVRQEAQVLRRLVAQPPYRLSFTPQPTPMSALEDSHQPRVAIIRSPGSNGDREMTAAFLAAGLEPWDVTMSDLVEGRINLNDGFRGLAFVGGFSYADVMDSAKGWAGVIRFNPRVSDQFEQFYHREDTFSLGICNGCQLMALLGWVPSYGLAGTAQPRFIRNRSGRFESRFVAVEIGPSPSVLLKGMEGSTLGVWVAHGEGQLYVPDDELLTSITGQQLAPVRYVDYENGLPTEVYPFNPNGSPLGIAGLCSADGRHLAMMPHPERTFQLRLWPWLPQQWKELVARKELVASPWLQLFQNARKWCEETA